jgi:hypothetical protein
MDCDHVVCALRKEAVSLLALFTYLFRLALSALRGQHRPSYVDHGDANAEKGECAPERRVAACDEI